MNIERLNLMVTMLEEVLAGTWKPIRLPSKKNLQAYSEVSYGLFSNDDTEEVFDLDNWFAYAPKLDCGFTACAMGHAALDSRFRKKGLKLNYTQDGHITYKDFEGFDAAEAFFDLEFNSGVIQSLTSPYRYPNHLKGNDLLKQVIRRFKLLIECKDEQKYLNKLAGKGFTFSNRLIRPDMRVYSC